MVGTRDTKREMVRGILRQGGVHTKATLAERTGLTQVTCAAIVSELIEAGEVRELDSLTRGGQPARRFELIPDHRLAVLIVFESEHLHCNLPLAFRCRVVDLLGKVRAEELVDCGSAATPARLYQLLAKLKKSYPALASVAISFPGPVARGVVGTGGDERFAAFFGIDLVREIAERTRLEAAVANDMNLAALGYYRKNAAALPETFAYLGHHPNTLPGCGLVVNGRILEGAGGFAGEVKYLCTSLKQREQILLLASRAERRKLIVRTICALTAILNPACIVLSGETFCDPPFIRDIRKDCAAVIPDSFLPRLVIQDEWLADIWDGLSALAHISLTNERS